MKVFLSANSLFMVGKVSQLRHYLTRYAMKHGTLKELLEKNLL
ncbi:MAG: Z-ring formation inhibitor MciZ [Clostridia bacterium]|nr:Z-ring formation inhibitor MciZ [Clostridia bacterium]